MTMYRKLDRLYRKAIYDCFQEYLGCKTADDMYEIMISDEGIKRYNEIVDKINSRIAKYTGHPLSAFRNVERLEESPWDKGEERLEQLRASWIWVYDDPEGLTSESIGSVEPIVVVSSPDIMTGLKKVITFDLDYYPIGSTVSFKYKTSAAGNDLRDKLLTGTIKEYHTNHTTMVVQVNEGLKGDFEITADNVHWNVVEIIKEKSDDT